MGAEVIILANPYTYNFLKGLTHSAMMLSASSLISQLSQLWSIPHLVVRHLPHHHHHIGDGILHLQHSLFRQTFFLSI